MLAAQHIKVKHPKKFLSSGSFGTMGFSIPAAIGAYYANPDNTIILAGDIQGNSVKYAFTNSQLNPDISDSVFDLDLPQDIDIIDNRSSAGD